MDPQQRLETYTAFADNTRKWVTVMDAKAALLSALNGVLIGFLWAGVKLADAPFTPYARDLGVVASIAAFLALLAALWSIIPRERLSVLFGGTADWSAEYRPFSFYGFIAARYKPADFAKLEADLGGLDEAALAKEALEQHFTNSHVVLAKSVCVTRSGYLTLVAILFAGAASILKVGGI